MEMSHRERTICALLPVLLLIYQALAIQYFEKIPISSGLGWDGESYAQFVMNLTDKLEHKDVPRALLGRVVPIIVSHYSHRLLGKEITTQSVIFSFHLMNAILLFSAAVIWLRIAKLLKLSFMSTLLSFSALFVNYEVLKMSIYYPVLMDHIALSWSIFLLYLYLNENDTLLLIFAVIGALIFPTLFICGSLMYLFPHRRPLEARREDSKFARLVNAVRRMPTKRFNAILFSIVAFGFFGAFAYAFFHLGYRLAAGFNNPDLNLKLPVSAACVLLLLYAIVRSMDFDLMLSKLKNDLMIRRGLILLALYVVISVAVTAGSYPASRPRHLFFLGGLIYESLANPWTSILAHTLYFGPSIILIIIYWKKFVEFLKTQSLGIISIVYFFLFIGIGSDSREYVVGLPFFVYVLYRALGNLEFNRRFIVIFVSISVLFSKAWFHINKFPLTGDFSKFPFQRYFMTAGPYMSDQMYYLQGAAAVLVLAVFYLCSRKGLLRFG